MHALYCKLYQTFFHHLFFFLNFLLYIVFQLTSFREQYVVIISEDINLKYIQDLTNMDLFSIL